MVDWDKELKEAKLRLLKRVYEETMKKIEERNTNFNEVKDGNNR